MRYGEWLFIWLDSFVKPKVKATTYHRYCRIINFQIVPNLGEYDLDGITAFLIQSKISLFSRKYSSNTVKMIVHIIKSSLNCAAGTGKIKPIAFDVLALPKPCEKTVECFTSEEQEKIESYILDSEKPKLFGILLAMYTGLRIGELLALKWTDFNLSRGYISVENTCYDSWENGKYRKQFQPAKTKSSRRLVPIPKQLSPYFRKLKKQSKSEFIVSGKDGEDVSIRSYQRTFELLQKRLGIVHRGFHALRHTFATRALECGMDVKTLSEILGHSDPNVTLRRYTHSLLDRKISLMNKMGQKFRLQRQKQNKAAPEEEKAIKKQACACSVCSRNSVIHEHYLHIF